MPRLGTAALAFSVVAALALTPSANGTFSGENGRIYYQIGALSPSTIMSACYPGGTHVKTVKTGAMWPDPSPDGKKLAYVKQTAQGYNDGVWVADADGSNPVQITTGQLSPAWPRWSPAGTQLVFYRYVLYPALGTSVYQPVVADVSSHAVSALFSDKDIESPSLSPGPAWSPGGTTIFFHVGDVNGGMDIWQVPATGGTPTRHLGTDAKLPFYTSIDLSPDGSNMFVTRQTQEQTFGVPPTDSLMEVLRYPVNGGGAGTVLSNINATTGTGDEGFGYSPDGTKIVFSRLPSPFPLYVTDVGDDDRSDAVPFGTAAGAYAAWSSNIDDCTDPGAGTMKINEVGTGDKQFIELLDSADEPFPTDQGGYAVVTYDGTGKYVGQHNISTARLQGRDNTQPLLLSFPEANAAYGVTGDEQLSARVPDVGQACFEKGFPKTKVSCVAWGCITTAVSQSTARIPAPGAGQSTQRQGIGSNTFHLAMPTPKATNVAGTPTDACVTGGGDLPAGGDSGGGGGGDTSNPTGGGAGTGGTGSSTGGIPKAPVLTLTGGGTVELKGDSVSFTMGCAAGGPACAGSATLTTTGGTATRAKRPKVIRLGSTKIKIAPGTRAKVKIKLKPAAKKLVKKRKKVKAKLTIIIAGAKPLTKTVTLKR